MSELAWAITQLIGATAAIAAGYSSLIRNGFVSRTLASTTTLALWYWFIARADAFWPIAAITVVPIVIATSIGVAALGRAERATHDDQQ
ncbi:MAG: hypothetical protein ABIQ70_04560 [Dokdonella sp.]